jgi:hypothetical protein
MGGMMNDPSESKQDVGELNLWTLIGCTDERGDAWHRRDDLQGAEDNHYPGFIPLEDVKRRLFGWAPRKAKVAYLVPCEIDKADFINGEGLPMRVVETQQGRFGVLRDDDDYDLGVFRTAEHPPYSVTLIREAERLTGAMLGISTAGCLQRGARAWVEYSMQESLHDDKSGLDYRPNLIRADSMDGTISLTSALTVEATVCMNTLRRNLVEAKGSGRIFKRKHTSGIVSGSLEDERAVLGILEQVDTEFLDGLHSLIDTPVSPKQRIALLDIIVPLPEEKGRSYTMAENRRDQLLSLDYNPMVEPWVGTAFGEIQRYNTEQHWFAPMKGGNRWERNVWRGITGKQAESDAAVVGALAKVLA